MKVCRGHNFHWKFHLIECFSDHISLHIRAVGEWTNRLLEFFEREQERLHSGEVAAYDEKIQQEEKNQKESVTMEAYIKDSKCEKVDERSDGLNMKKNLLIAKLQEEMMQSMKAEKGRAFSMPDIENKVKSTERFKKWVNAIARFFLMLFLVVCVTTSGRSQRSHSTAKQLTWHCCRTFKMLTIVLKTEELLRASDTCATSRPSLHSKLRRWNRSKPQETIWKSVQFVKRSSLAGIILISWCFRNTY